MQINTLTRVVIISCLAFNIQACSSKPSAKVMQLLQKSRSDMAYVQGGTFTMGQVYDPMSGQLTQFYTPHQVTLTPYYISKYNVSYGDFDIYTEATDKPYIDNELRKLKDFSRAPNMPVADATWYQAHDYCAWLAKQTGLSYALPTEAQWEYAARNRGNPHWFFPTNNGKQELGVNFPDDTQLTTQPENVGGIPTPLPVGSIHCTPMGICGMTGEVNAWVNDWNQRDYSPNPVTDPQGPASGTQKVIRGGGAQGSPEYNNSINRAGQPPNTPMAGFRCVINSALPADQLGVFAAGYPK